MPTCKVLYLTTYRGSPDLQEKLKKNGTCAPALYLIHNNIIQLSLIIQLLPLYYLLTTLTLFTYHNNNTYSTLHLHHLSFHHSSFVPTFTVILHFAYLPTSLPTLSPLHPNLDITTILPYTPILSVLPSTPSPNMRTSRSSSNASSTSTSSSPSSDNFQLFVKLLSGDSTSP